MGKTMSPPGAWSAKVRAALLAWVIARPSLGARYARKAFALGRAIETGGASARAGMASMAVIGALALAGRAILRAAPNKEWARTAANALNMKGLDHGSELAWRERSELRRETSIERGARRGPRRL